MPYASRDKQLAYLRSYRRPAPRWRRYRPARINWRRIMDRWAETGRLLMPRQRRQPEPWQLEDAVASFNEAIAEIGRRVKAGEPLPTTGYFGKSER